MERGGRVATGECVTFFNDTKFELTPEELVGPSYPTIDIKWAVETQRTVLASR